MLCKFQSLQNLLKISCFHFFCSYASGREFPEIFEGFFEMGVPVTASVGTMAPPEEINKYITKVEAAIREKKDWFREYFKGSKLGVPLPFHMNLGLNREEYDHYCSLWAKRKFKSFQEVTLLLRKNFSETWTLTASGEAAILSTLRYDSEKDLFYSPNGKLKRVEEINTDADSILGAWAGKEWLMEEQTLFGKTKENFAIGSYKDQKIGLIVYKIQEISMEGIRLLDKSLVLRFHLK